jgi:hypothetical protein
MCLQLPTVYQRNLCFRHWLRTIVQNDVLQYIPATCAAIQLQTRKVVFDCHWLMHGVSEGMVYFNTTTTTITGTRSKQKLTIQQLKIQTLKEYSSCKTACDWACYHAVAAGYVRELVQRNINSLTTNFVAALDHLCAALTASKTGSDSQLQIDLYFHCYHGVGHAIIWVWNDLDPNNVAPIIPVNTALTICDSLQGSNIPGEGVIPTKMTAYFCRSGLYMQLWENHMKTLRDGRNDQTFEELKSNIISLMIQLCTDHSLNNDACGEVWAEAGLLETDGNKILSLNLCLLAYNEMLFPNTVIKQKCEKFVNKRPPPVLNDDATYCTEGCGLLCESTQQIFDDATSTAAATTSTTRSRKSAGHIMPHATCQCQTTHYALRTTCYELPSSSSY